MKGIFGILWPVCALAFGLVAFTACGDDEDENGGDGGTGGSGNLPTLSGVGITDPVTQIRHDMSGGRNEASTFNYADGRMTGGSSMVDDLDFTITYSPFQITATDAGYYETYTNIQTNAYGSITYADVAYGDEEDGDYSDGINISIRATYDENNQLLTYTECEMETFDGMEYRDEGTATYTWENGNVVKQVWSEASYENGVLVWSEESESYTFDYGSTPVSNNGIYVYDIIPDTEFMMYAGFLGKPTKDIPVAVTEAHGGDYSRYTSVDKDGKGRITALHMESSYYGTSTMYFGYADSPINVTSAQAQVKKHTAKQPRRTRLIERMKASQQDRD